MDVIDGLTLVAPANTPLPHVVTYQYLWSGFAPSDGTHVIYFYFGSKLNINTGVNTEIPTASNSTCIGCIDVSRHVATTMKFKFTITFDTIHLVINDNTYTLPYTNGLNGSHNIQTDYQAHTLQKRKHHAVYLCKNAIANIRTFYFNSDKLSVLQDLESIMLSIKDASLDTLINLSRQLEQTYNCTLMNTPLVDSVYSKENDVLHESNTCPVKINILEELCTKKNICQNILDAAHQCMQMYEESQSYGNTQATILLRDIVTHLDANNLQLSNIGSLLQQSHEKLSELNVQLYSLLLQVNDCLDL